MKNRSRWRSVSLVLGVLALAIPLGIALGALALVMIIPDLNLSRIGDLALISYVFFFLAQLIHGFFVMHRFGRTATDAMTHRLRTVLLGPIGVYLNVRDMTRSTDVQEGSIR